MEKINPDELDILNDTRGKGQRKRYEPDSRSRGRDTSEHSYHARDTSDVYKKLSDKQRKFVDTYLLTEDKRLAMKEANYSPNTGTFNVMSNPNVKEAIKRCENDLWETFKDYAELALQVQVDMLTNDKVSFKVKLDASNSILDRAGYKPADRKEIVGAIGTVAVESKAVNDFAERARQLLQQKGLIDPNEIVDAEIVDD